jgi:hypothetical protein
VRRLIFKLVLQLLARRRRLMQVQKRLLRIGELLRWRRIGELRRWRWLILITRWRILITRWRILITR